MILASRNGHFTPWVADEDYKPPFKIFGTVNVLVEDRVKRVLCVCGRIVNDNGGGERNDWM